MGWLTDLLRVVFPLTCEVCGNTLVDGEAVMCLDCYARMPRELPDTDIHGAKSRKLAAMKIERMRSMFVYVRDTDYARVIQRSKYNNRPDIDATLATVFATELLREDFFAGIDVIVPVPMAPFKKVRRGFNQAEEIAKGVSAVTGLPIGDNLVAAGHATQTRKSALERFKNAEGTYSVAYPDELVGKHVLIVDDVITTGATVTACAAALRRSVQDVKVSVLTLASTRME